MIIIVGSSGGLGKEITENLFGFDDIIFTHFSNNNSSKINGKNSQFLDLSDFNSIDNFISANIKNLKNINYINFSAFSKDGLLYGYKNSDWKRTFDVNLNGPVYLIKKLLPIMVSNKYGRIINISSYLASHGAIGASAYSSSKSALIGLTKTMSKEYGRFNILSNIIELGYFNVGLSDSLEEKKVNQLKKDIPVKKFGDSIEVVNIIKLLINSNYINGSQIKVNGGL